MVRTRSEPRIADRAPQVASLTAYDRAHLITYLRLLDADAEGASWEEVASIVLKLDPQQDRDHARAVWESHLERARWMTRSGYHHLLRE